MNWWDWIGVALLLGWGLLIIYWVDVCYQHYKARRNNMKRNEEIHKKWVDWHKRGEIR